MGAFDRLGPETDLVAERVRQHRQQHSDQFAVVVEGTPDKRVIERVHPSTKLAIFPAGPRPCAIRAAESLLLNGDPSWLCVVDRDFDDVVNAKLAEGLDLLTYDNADLESMIWTSPALEEFIFEIGSQAKLEELGGIEQLRHMVRASLRPITRLRAASAQKAWGLIFDGFDLRKKASKETLEIPIQSICDAVSDGETTATKSEIYEAAVDFPIPECPATGQELVHGKDAVALTGVALRSLVGNLSHQAADPKELQKSLRLTAASYHLVETTWLTVLGARIAAA